MRWLWLSAVVVVADLVSKAAAERLLADGPISVMPGLNLILAYNSGMAFGLLAADKWQLLLQLLPLIICVVLLYWLHTAKRTLERIALGLIIGGAVGNLYERLLYGKVTDFIDVYLYQWHWPAFNIADSAITVGAIIFIYCIWVEGRSGTNGTDGHTKEGSFWVELRSVINGTDGHAGEGSCGGGGE